MMTAMRRAPVESAESPGDATGEHKAERQSSSSDPDGPNGVNPTREKCRSRADARALSAKLGPGSDMAVSLEELTEGAEVFGQVVDGVEVLERNPAFREHQLGERGIFDPPVQPQRGHRNGLQNRLHANADWTA